MKKYTILKIAGFFIIFLTSACMVSSCAKQPDIKNISEEMSSNSYVSYNIATTEVAKTAMDLKDYIGKIPNAYIESISIQQDYANIQFFVPENQLKSIYEKLSRDKLTSYSQSSNSNNSTYLIYAKKYEAYNALVNNFDEISNLIKKNDNKTDISILREDFISNMKNNLTYVDKYNKQKGKAQVYIYLSKPQNNTVNVKRCDG